jgi:putative transcriptional regulator
MAASSYKASVIARWSIRTVSLPLHVVSIDALGKWKGARSGATPRELNDNGNFKYADSRISVLKPEAILVQKGFDHVRWFSQAKFATLLRVEVSTLRNWEQGRRESTGPAKALLYAIRKNPIRVLKALAACPGKVDCRCMD